METNNLLRNVTDAIRVENAATRDAIATAHAESSNALLQLGQLVANTRARDGRSLSPRSPRRQSPRPRRRSRDDRRRDNGGSKDGVSRFPPGFGPPPDLAGLR